MTRKITLIIVFLPIFLFNSWSQSIEDFAVHFRPGVEIPIGEKSVLTDQNGTYKIGGSTGIFGQYIFPRLPLLYLEGHINVGLHPTPAQDILALTSAGMGLGFDLRVADALSIQLGGEAGGSLGFFGSNEAAGNPYFGGTAGVILDLSPGFAISAGGSYRYHMGWDETAESYTDLYQGVAGWLGTVLRFNPESGRQKLQVLDIKTEPIFPVFFGYYEDNSFGTLTIKNLENSSISNVDVYFDVGEYMEQPVLTESISSIGRNEEADIDLKALFTSRVMNLTESAKVSSEIRIDYTYLGERFSYTYPHTVRILDRNSMTWDDDRKAASFVTSRDPSVLIFSKNTAGIIRDLGKNPLNLNFRIAMGLFETLKIYGMNYVIDPQSSFVEASQDALFLDYLQFPSQSLIYRAGDCDDLSILFAALLESVGIETAFITVPGHIFMAFSLGLSPNEAVKEFTNTDDFIFIEDGTWVPLETTMIQEGFLKSFRTGAKQWRDAVAKEVNGFFPIHRAWETYQPVGFNSGALSLLFPDPDDIIENYTTNLDAYVSQEIRAQVEYFESRIRNRGDKPGIRNSFGILYARYGLFDKAEEQFLAAINLNRSAHNTMVNLGNLYFLQDDMHGALEWYEKAAALAPDNHLVIAGIARAKFELEDYQAAQDEYSRLAEVNPEMAANYSYIGNTNSSIVRAASAMDKGKTFWEDDEENEEGEE
ncbi:MAG: hypothetical protein JEY99_01275 [Spirochaetales bacterium]|nr:hypothetical protein [Spirochaetales bacterium]